MGGAAASGLFGAVIEVGEAALAGGLGGAREQPVRGFGSRLDRQRDIDPVGPVHQHAPVFSSDVAGLGIG